MIKQFSTLAIAAATLALASPAFAAGDKAEGKAKSGPVKQFERFDQNDDGVVDAEEVKQRLEKFMKRADANGDGVVDADEVKALREKIAKKGGKQAENFDKKFKKLDTDGDGRITEREALTRPGWFDRADKDKDGKVTKAEIEELAAKRRQKEPAEAKKPKPADADATDGDEDKDDE
ncbi:EF-hand domain-containing protein [Methylopila sp. M107]|uniref:EF-hand domain-containing protein n=1 Tax=Methylopila sp. M107 TaxID=1101190 RepID=UPI00035E40BD|nr:EF-hand domain-containing protein [Methylopila sp. M107]